MAELIEFTSFDEFLSYNEDFIKQQFYSHYYLIRMIEQVLNRQVDVYNSYNIVDGDNKRIMTLHVDGACLIYSNGWNDEMLNLLSEQIDLKKATVNFDFSGNRHLIKQLFQKQNEPFEIFKERLIYQCEELNEIPSDIGGQAELCTFRDFKRLKHLAYEYHLEEYGSKAFRDLNSISDLVEKGIRAETFYLYRDSGIICCMAQLFGKETGYPWIGGFVTEKGQRNKGYASAFLYDLTEMVFNEGFEKCGLVSDATNPASNKVFKRVGYVPIYEYISMHALNPSAYSATGFEVRPL